MYKDTKFGGSDTISPVEAQRRSAAARKANNYIKAGIEQQKGLDACDKLLCIAYDKALDGDKDMLKYLIDQMEGKAIQRIENSVENKQDNMPLSHLPDEALDQIGEILAKYEMDNN